MLFVFVYVWWCPTHVVLCFCFVFLRLVYPMLPVSLGCVVFLFCFSSSCVPYVASYSELSFFLLPHRYSLTFIYRISYNFATMEIKRIYLLSYRNRN